MTAILRRLYDGLVTMHHAGAVVGGFTAQGALRYP